MSANAKIIDYLRRAQVRDREREGPIGSGLRTTREVADACDVTPDTARKWLHRAVDRDEVEAFDGGASGLSGNEISWRLKP